MKNNDFSKKSKTFQIVKFHLKENWKISIFFISFWFIIMLGALLMTMMGHFGIFIAKYDTPHGSNFAISDILNMAIFSFAGIVYFSIFIVYFINKIIISEILNCKMSLWLSLPFSRKEILNAKNIFIGIMIFAVFIPSYLLLIIFSAFAYDVKQNIGYVILYGIQFILLILVIWFLYNLISMLLMPSAILINIIIGIILFWITAVSIIYSVFIYMFPDSSWVKYIQFASPQLLLVSPLHFSNEVHWNSDHTIGLYQQDVNFILLGLLTVAMPLINIGLFFLNNLLFKNKDLNV